jgi:hypothetical protein
MPTPPNYQQWIAAHQPTDPRGQCVDATLRMATAFPELRRVRGHYVCPLDGRRSHWWLVTPDGQILDPTVEQFASNGMGEYEPYIGKEPTGQCLDCGALLFDSETFCNATCAMETAKFMAEGGRVFVNGKDITPDGAASSPSQEREP